ncbi:MAG TPA: hypothetical protein VNZ57_13070, partial [Longimicrobiales bacterium]|nr:hypothetical protein [Longimicrobiales bacterium]
MRTTTGTGAEAACRWYRIAALFGVVAAVMLSPSPAEAQYFGRNKVQYSVFDFRVLGTEHYDVHYYSEISTAAREAARMAERWYTRLSQLLDHQMTSRQPLVLYANHGDFQQTNVVPGMIDESTGGVTEGLQRRVVMPLGATRQDTDHVLGHELVHAFQYDIASAHGGPAATGNLPLWAMEGMAEYLSVGRSDPHTAMWLRDAVLHDDVPTLGQLSTDGRYFPYRFGQAVWAYIGGRYGDARIGEIYRTALDEGLATALAEVLEVNPDSLSAAWVAAVKDAYAPLLEGRAAPDDVARRVMDGSGGIAETMLAPAVSPDGSRIAFLWVRDLSIDLYVLDARTGTAPRRLLTQATESRFDALSFMGSAGTWSPDGTRLATVVFSGGRQEIA